MSNDVLVYVRQFRIKELQEALSLLGLPKYGRKDELKARLERHFLELGGDLRQHDLAVREVTRIWRRMKGLPLEDLGPTNGPRTSFNVRLSQDGAGPSSTGQKASSRGYPGAASNPRFENGLPDCQFPRGNTKSSLHNVLDSPLNSRGFQPASFGRPQPGQPPPPANSTEANTEIRCVCGHNTDVGEMIQCEGEKCGVWQHSHCVGVDPREVPDHYFCELCRIARADPFWVRVSANYFPPARLIPQQQGLTLSPDRVPALMVRAERNFNLTYQHLQLCAREDHQLQLTCVLFGDKVPFRLHWPQHADLRINLRGYRPYSRNNGNKLGNNAVDDPANLSPYVKQGGNLVSLSGTDARPFCMVLQLAKRRSVDEVKAMMAPPETTEQALQRVRNQTGGGQQNDSDDEGLEISATVLSLRDPNTSTRVVTPARFLGVGGIVAFDLDTYLDVVRRSRKWLCPFSTKTSSIRELQLDGFLGPVLAALKDYPDIMEVEVSPDATWRLAGSTGRWNAITDDPAIVAAALAEARTAIKKDPDPLTSLPVNQDDGSTSEEVSEGEEMRKAAKAYASKAHVPPPPKPEVIVLSDSDSEESPLSKPPQRQPILIPPNGPIAHRLPPDKSLIGKPRASLEPLRGSFLNRRAAVEMLQGGMPSPRPGGSASRRRGEGGGRSAADLSRYNPYGRPLETSQSAGSRHVVSPTRNGVTWDPSRSAAMNAGRMPNQQQNPPMVPVFDYSGSSSHQPPPGLPIVQSVPLPMSSYGQQQPPGPPLPLRPMPGPPPPFMPPPFNPFNATPYAPSNLPPGHIGPPLPQGGMSDIPPRPPCDYGQPQASGSGPSQGPGAGPGAAGGYSQSQGGNYLPPPSEFTYPAPGMGGYGPPGGFPGPPLPMPPVMPGFGGQEGDFGGAGHPRADGAPQGSGFGPLPPPPPPPQMNGYMPQQSRGFARAGSGGYASEQQGGPTYAAAELTHPVPGSGRPVLPPPPGDNMPGPKNVGPPDFLQDSFLDQLLADGIPGQDALPSEPDRPCGPLEPTPFQLIGARSRPMNHNGVPWGHDQATNNGPGEQPAWVNGQAVMTGPSEITVISDSD